MKQFYVIGNPIKHSLSPKIFNYLFDHFKITARYETKLIKDDDEFCDFITQSKNNVSGYNITSPYKEIAFKIVDEIDDSAKKNKSVNCIKVKKNKLIGYNTDEYGFSRMILNNKILLNNNKILILGYGKAAETIVYYLIQNSNSNVYIHGRNKIKIQNFIKKFENKNIRISDSNCNKMDIIINCLSTKINSKNLASLLSYLPVLKTDIFIDLNYVKINLEEILVNKYISGIDMLIFQALKSFDLWFEKKSKKNYLEIYKILK